MNLISLPTLTTSLSSLSISLTFIFLLNFSHNFSSFSLSFQRNCQSIKWLVNRKSLRKYRKCISFSSSHISHLYSWIIIRRRKVKATSVKHFVPQLKHKIFFINFSRNLFFFLFLVRDFRVFIIFIFMKWKSFGNINWLYFLKKDGYTIIKGESRMAKFCR